MSNIELLSKVIGQNSANKIAKIFQACPCYNAKQMQKNYLKLYPEAKVVAYQRLEPELYNIYYGRRNAKDVVPDDEGPYVSSYVPFSRGETNLFIYNFMERNYGIRGPSLIRISIMEGEKFIWAKQYLMKPQAVMYLKNFAHDADAVIPRRATAVLEAFNPRFKSRTNEYRFIGIYRDKEKKRVAGVHSMGSPIKPYLNLTNFCFRAYVPQGQSACYSNYAHPYQELDPNVKKNVFLKAQTVSRAKGTLGYCAISSDDGGIASIWHDTCEDNMVNLKVPRDREVSQPCRCSFLVPDFQLHAPLILVNFHEVGFEARTFTMKAYRESGEFLCQKDVVLKGIDNGFDLREQFAGKNLTGSVYFVVEFGRDMIKEFQSRPILHLHLYYRVGDLMADQTFSLHSYGYHNDPLPKSKSYRCLKYAPLFKEFRSVYAVSTVGGNGKNPDDTVKLRIFTDTGTEHVINDYKLLDPDGLSTIHGDDLMQEVGSYINESAVLCIEAQTTNFKASWFAIDRESGHLATDHFTGG